MAQSMRQRLTLAFRALAPELCQQDEITRLRYKLREVTARADEAQAHLGAMVAKFDELDAQASEINVLAKDLEAMFQQVMRELCDVEGVDVGTPWEVLVNRIRGTKERLRVLESDKEKAQRARREEENDRADFEAACRDAGRVF